MNKVNVYIAALLCICFFSIDCLASEAEIIEAKAERNAAQNFNISVTVKHGDTGWDHYANAWRIYAPDGKLLAERTLHHPHVKEQPFTRSLLGVRIPLEASEITIVPVCSVYGESEKGYLLKLR